MISMDKTQCTYCGACFQICPKHCISMEEDEDGFRYPVVNDELCIQCGRCNAVCPIEKAFKMPSITAYAAVNRKIHTMIEASSGGIFGAIATYILENGGVVYGCAFSDKLEAKHIRVDTMDKLPLLYGSKYVQSNIGDSYVSVKKDLEDERWVAFSGTPCQVAGLISFLGKDYRKLLLIDIICHGVPSQAYFDKYINWLERSERGRIQEYMFRSKNNHGWSLAGGYTVIKDNNRKVKKKLFYFDHYYYFYFLESSIYRECCYSCKYANLKRIGDFTLGDLWGAERLNLPLDIKNGCSVVLVNSDKGRSIIDRLDISKASISIAIATKYNEQLNQPSKLHPDRCERLQEFRENTGDELQRQFIDSNTMNRLKGKLKYLIPISLAQSINKIRFKLSP